MMTRANGIAYALFFLLLTLGWKAGCNLDLEPLSQLPPVDDSGQQQPVEVRNGSNPQPSGSPHHNQTGTIADRLIIGSFNIQVFGVAKSSDPFVMERLVDITRRFDLLAIQELRARDQSVIVNFVSQVNADGSRYGYVVGKRQGRTVSKEQYVYVYDTQKLRLTTAPYDVIDPTGQIHRPPLIASFETIVGPGERGFSFTALNMHVDPDEVDQELAALEETMTQVMLAHPNEDDFILMGDFNGTPSQLSKFRLLRNQLPLVRSNWPTKPRSRRSIDNVLIDSIRTAEYRNQAGVLDVATHYGLSVNDAVRISDHYPVWSVFSTREQVSRVASTNMSRGGM